MTAMEYLCKEHMCDPEDLELVHVVTLQAFMDVHGLETKEAIDALIWNSAMARAAAQNALAPPE